MAGRPTKAGLDYFELDCHFDEKIRLIQAEFGLKGLAVIVLLYKEIYSGQGYYMTWNEDRLLLLMSENGVAGGDKNLIEEIVSACIRRDIFSEELFDKYHILTSSGIQKRYLNAVSRREKVELKKEYLLITVPKNSIYVCRNSINVDRNSINVDRNSQSRVEKSKVEKSIERVSNDTLCQTQSVRRIVGKWNELSVYGIKKISKLQYSSKRYKSLVARINEYGEDRVMEAIENIKESNYLQGKNKNGWAITFDWFVLPNNFPKVLERNYDNWEPNMDYQNRTGEMLRDSYEMISNWAEEKKRDGAK